MKNFLKAYLKCVIANKATLLGLIFMIFSLAVSSFSRGAAFGFLSMGISLLFSTIFGLGTYFAYQRTITHIKIWGVDDLRFYSRYSGNYCNRVGVQLALKESESRK